MRRLRRTVCTMNSVSSSRPTPPPAPIIATCSGLQSRSCAGGISNGVSIASSDAMPSSAGIIVVSAPIGLIMP